MNLPLFLARRIYSNEGDHRKVSRPAIHISTIGVTIGLLPRKARRPTLCVSTTP